MLLLLSLLTSPAQAQQAPGITLVLPLGVPQFVQKQAPAGLVYGGLQLAGAGVAVGSSIGMRQAAEDGNVERELNLRMLSAGGVALGVGSWFTSMVAGSRTQQEQQQEMALSAMRWQQQSLLASAPPLVVAGPQP